MRSRVSTCAAAGWSHETIARTIGIARETLLKYFADDLELGAMRKKAEALEGLQKAAKKGNAAAVRLFLQMYPELTPGGERPPAEAPAKAAMAPKLGKKEQAQAEATTAQEKDPEWRELLPRPSVLQ